MIVAESDKSAISIDSLTVKDGASIGIVATAKQKTLTFKNAVSGATAENPLVIKQVALKDGVYEEATPGYTDAKTVLVTDKSKTMTADMFDVTGLKADGKLTGKSGKFTVA